MHRPSLCILIIPSSLFLVISVANSDQKPTRAFEQLVSVLEWSRDASLLEQAAKEICRHKDPKAIEFLTNWLLKPEVWPRLDREEDYQRYSRYLLRVNRIVMALGQIATPEAEAALLKLADNRPFTAELDRVDGIIEAAGAIRKPSTKLLTFLDSKATPDSGQRTLVMRTLAQMRCLEACKLIEKRIHSSAYRNSTKEDWFMHDLMVVRNDPEIVALYKRTLSSPIKDTELRNRVVQGLFSYSPLWFGIWESTDPIPAPPKRKDASTEVLGELLEIAEMTKKLDLWAGTHEGVQKAVKEIKEILAEREKKK